MINNQGRKVNHCASSENMAILTISPQCNKLIKFHFGIRKTNVKAIVKGKDK